MFPVAQLRSPQPPIYPVPTRMGIERESDTSERRVIADDPGLETLERARHQLQCHEHVVRNVVLGAKPEPRRGDEAESRIVLRVAEYYHRFISMLDAGRDAG